MHQFCLICILQRWLLVGGAAAGVTVRYKIRRKLVRDRTAKAKLEMTEITESKFADDAALHAVTIERQCRV